MYWSKTWIVVGFFGSLRIALLSSSWKMPSLFASAAAESARHSFCRALALCQRRRACEAGKSEAEGWWPEEHLQDDH